MTVDATPARRGAGLLLLLLVPIAALIYAFSDKLHLPADHAGYLRFSLAISLGCYLVVWAATMGRPRRHGVDIPMFIFLLMLWVIAGIAGLAAMNQRWDGDGAATHHAAITRKHAGSSSKGGGSCTVWLSPHSAELTVMQIRRDYCPLVQPGNDGLEFRLAPGALGMPWARDYAVIRDYALWKERLGK